MLHYYLCHFHIYRAGNMKSRPHIRPRYIQADNAANAYQKAQEICSSTKLGNASDNIVCKHSDIQCVTAESARREIAMDPHKFIESSKTAIQWLRKQ